MKFQRVKWGSGNQPAATVRDAPKLGIGIVVIWPDHRQGISGGVTLSSAYWRTRDFAVTSAREHRP